MISKILVIGADGQLGFDLMRVFGEQAVGLTHRDIEITNRQQTNEALKEYKPDIVINTASFVKAEACELEPNKCFSVNALGAYNVAKASADLGADVVFISSDYVFDGSKEDFNETDIPNPLNIYGASKLAGENLVKIANSHHYIVRTSWFFGVQASHKGYDFPRLMLKLANEQPEIRVVNDQFGSPTYTNDLALKIKELIVKKAPYGIYHITNQGRCSWYEFAKKVFELAIIKTNLIPINTQNSPSKIKRPRSSVLMNSRLPQLDIELLRHWSEALKDYFKEIQDE